MFAANSRRCLRRDGFVGTWRRNRCGFLCGLLLLTCVSTRAHGQIGVAGRSYPSQTYFSTFSAVAERDYPAALKWFRNAARAGVRSAHGRWIDSICYYAMTGAPFGPRLGLPDDLPLNAAVVGVVNSITTLSEDDQEEESPVTAPDRRETRADHRGDGERPRDGSRPRRSRGRSRRDRPRDADRKPE